MAGLSSFSNCRSVVGQRSLFSFEVLVLMPPSAQKREGAGNRCFVLI
jgi:hypothetical protein